jgi:hypothetical protein
MGVEVKPKEHRLVDSDLDPDTVGVLMIPTQDIQAHTTDLKGRDFNIDSPHNFKDLRGGQSGTGDEQTLIVWTTSGIDLSTITSNL